MGGTLFNAPSPVATPYILFYFPLGSTPPPLLLNAQYLYSIHYKRNFKEPSM